MRRFAPFIVTLILAAPVAYSQSEQKQTISNLELPNRDIRDILQIFAHELEVTILADSTVSGSTSYFVRSEMEVERAFQVFLDSNKLYVAKNEDVYTVSRIGVAYHEEALTVDAESMCNVPQ